MRCERPHVIVILKFKLTCRYIHSPIQTHTHIHINTHAHTYTRTRSHLRSGAAPVDTWEWWNHFRTLCGAHANLGVALTLTARLPADQRLERWYGEPVKAVYIPMTTFVPNSTGFPSLPRAHQKFLARMFHQGAAVYITGRVFHPEGPTAPLRYLQHIYDKLTGSLSSEELQHSAYLDYLQAPLQPLADNLESQTYETFERDPVKYERYEEAVRLALVDRVAAEPDRVWVLMVVGAGRGPLVRASLRAAENARAKLRVYAVEKNPNAVITLRNMRETHKWGDRVTIVSHDMRTWDAPEKADILVSELLGSFGDNELSPECLDGAQKFLKDDGISIPFDYTSYIAPMCSEKLHNEVRAYGDGKSWETGYVVQIHNAHLVAQPEPLFVFEHPNRDDPIDNSRYLEVSFTATEAELVHGVAGYFESGLYRDVMISILPRTHSPGMFSWFPIYFPIREPLYVNRGDEIKIAFWRRGDRRKVWYEWCVSTPSGSSHIHNSRGKSSHITL
jgi:protein arginine N-methyltransferase 5